MSDIHINDAEYILLSEANRAHNILADRLSEVRKQCDDLQAENERLKSMTYCAYCGKEYPLDDSAASQVSEHIRYCEKHPMRKLQAEITKERKKYMDLVCQVIEATGVDVPTGGMTAAEAVKTLQAENERLRAQNKAMKKATSVMLDATDWSFKLLGRGKYLSRYGKQQLGQHKAKVGAATINLENALKGTPDES